MTWKVWYDRSMKKWKAAQFNVRGRQMTNAIVGKTKKEVEEKVASWNQSESLES